LKTLMLERIAPGGQAATSSKIENYLGFPTGLSGAELAGRATLQAQKFGAQLSTPAQVTRMCFEGKFPVLELEDGAKITAKALLIASGAEYRKLPVAGRERFDGAGVYYAATPMEAASGVAIQGGDPGTVPSAGSDNGGSASGEHGKEQSGKEAEKSASAAKSCLTKEECHKKRLLCGKGCTMSAHAKCAAKCSKACIPTC
jgi:hypothetical protein